MVSTRSKGKPSESADTGTKRAAAPTSGGDTKKAKVEKDGKLDVGQDGVVGLKEQIDGEAKEEEGEQLEKDGQTEQGGSGKDQVQDQAEAGGKAQEDRKGGTGEKGDEAAAKDSADVHEKPEVREKAEEGETGETSKPGEGPVVEDDAKGSSPGPTESPAHGHIYFLYRPKIDVEDVESVDDVSKFHILLIPKSGKYASRAHYHRIIEVGKKKLPDPGAKRQVIWGMVGSVSTNKAGLKGAFGEYSYETKTKGTRIQPAARPAARGHYILHSPQDTTADSPDHNKQRDYKTLLAYEITTPPPEDFGRVQEELGLEVRGAVALSVKDPEAAGGSNGNPRAANMPREKKAHYPSLLQDLFVSRRWIAPNPPTFLDYPGTELLLLSSPHELQESLGKDGEKVQDDMDEAAHAEATDVQGALRELGLGKGDVEIEALEGVWA